jgi:hypothetical protein
MVDKSLAVVVTFDQPITDGLAESATAFNVLITREKYAGGPHITEDHPSVSVSYLNPGLDVSFLLNTGSTVNTKVTSNNTITLAGA